MLISLFAWVLLPTIVAAQPVQEQARRPPPLEPLPECEIWTGTSSGNDPTSRMTMRICPVPPGTPGHPDAITGVFQWSSLQSGWSRRELAGRWLDGRTRLEMRDLRLSENRPLPGWTFCTVDRYELRRTSPTRLQGHYDSAACRDHSTVDLTLQGMTSAPPLTGVVPPAPPTSTSSCACTVATNPDATASRTTVPLTLLLVLAAVLRRRHRSHIWMVSISKTKSDGVVVST